MCDVIGSICSGYVPFHSEVACWRQTFRIRSFIKPICEFILSRLKENFRCTTCFDPLVEDKIFTKRTVFLWASRPRQAPLLCVLKRLVLPKMNKGVADAPLCFALSLLYAQFVVKYIKKWLKLGLFLVLGSHLDITQVPVSGRIPVVGKHWHRLLKTCLYLGPGRSFISKLNSLKKFYIGGILFLFFIYFIDFIFKRWFCLDGGKK